MSFVKNPAQQLSLDDAIYHLTQRELKTLENSWAKVFADEIFPKIDEELFRPLYCADNGAPNTPVNVIVGALILKDVLDYSDDDIVEGLMFDVRLQYALHTTSFKEQPLSDKTLQRFRRRHYAYVSENGNDLVQTCIISLSKEMAKVMEISGKTKRMDSMMIDANIKKLSRLELIYTCIANVVIRLKKSGVKNIPANLLHYAEDNDFNKVFYYAKSTEYSEKCLQLLSDADTLIDFCKDRYDDSEEYKLFSRCMSEQSIKENGKRRLTTSKDKVLNSSILQNPSDPEATFRSKAGVDHRGYVANLEESVGENASIITDYQYEQNIYSDSRFLEENLQATEASDEVVTLVTDGAYATSANMKLAAEKNVRLISTNMTGKKANEFYADFSLSEDEKEILACPGCEKILSCSNEYSNGQMRVTVSNASCAGCPHKNTCTAKQGKNIAAFTLSLSCIRRAKTQRMLSSGEISNYARLRNGVETLPSILRRNYNISALPRGRLPGKLFLGFKIAALNFRKLVTYTKGRGRYAQNPVIV